MRGFQDGTKGFGNRRSRFYRQQFLRLLVPRYQDLIFINIDKLTYAANLDNLKRSVVIKIIIYTRRHWFCSTVNSLFRQGIDYGTFCSESHVDNSIKARRSSLFQYYGCFNLLEAARAYGLTKFLQVSTDEVYGSIEGGGSFSESSPLAPNNPYAASKAASDCLVRAYHKTYGLNTNIARSTNNYGPCQHREKFIPATIYRALRDETVLIYGDGQQIREWLYVADHCSALEQILFNGRPGEVYNIGSGEERKNLELAGSILHILGNPPYCSLLMIAPDMTAVRRKQL